MTIPSSYQSPRFEPPFRAVVLVGALAQWWQADDAEKQSAMQKLSALLTPKPGKGATLLASVDDDFFMTGQPNSMLFSMYLVYEFDDPQFVVSLVHNLRSSTLAQYFRMEARLGRQLFLVER